MNLKTKELSLLEIKNLKASAEDAPILKGVSLSMKAGEIHAIMGPNGSGKSTLANAIMGNPQYEITSGDILFDGANIKETPVDERSHKGIFMIFQSPRSIAGVNIRNFLHTIKKGSVLAEKGMTLDEAKKDKEVRKSISITSFKKELNETLPTVDVKAEFMERYLNEGFSGGEKKKMEVLQMSLLKPKLLILDELDSGLDVDSLKVCCAQVAKMAKEHNMAVLVVTHFTRIFKYLSPDHVHKFKDGKIVESGGKELAEKIEAEGYLEEV